MFVLRRKDNHAIYSFEGHQAVSFLCRNLDAAERAVREIRRTCNIECVSEFIDPMTVSGLWCLAYRNGHKVGPEQGVNIVCHTEEVAEKCAGNFFMNTGKLVRPVPVPV